MVWQDDQDDNKQQVTDDIQDLRYRVEATTLPLDHAFALSEAVIKALPWLVEEPDAGIHLIHHPQPVNSLQRLSDEIDHEFHLSKRIRLTLRLPKNRLDDARALTGQTLIIKNRTMIIGESTSKPLSAITTQIAHNVIINEQESETEFIDRIVLQLTQNNIHIRKILCGRLKSLQFPDKLILVRSVLIADLRITESIKLQQIGIGEGRLFGCGIFIPHKGIATTNAAS